MISKKIREFIALLILIILAFIFIFPVIFIFANSFASTFEINNRYTNEILSTNIFGIKDNLFHFVEPTIIPDIITFSQYKKLLLETPMYLGLFWNSFEITLSVLIGQLVISIPASYSFAFSKIKHKEIIFFLYLFIMFMPMQLTLVSNYIVAEFLKINGTKLAVIIPGIVNPFGVYFLRQSMQGIPISYLESAQIDGAGDFKIMINIMLPLVKPAIATLSIITFLEYWNVVDQAVVFINNVLDEPLSVYLSRLSLENKEIIFSASFFYLLFPILIFLYGHENFIDNLSLSGLK